MGLLIRGQSAVDAAREDLRAALKHESPTVRVIAAGALGQFGNAADLNETLSVLKELASPEKNGAYVSMLDLNAIAALGNKVLPFMDLIKSLPTKDPPAVVRANSYLERLIADMADEDKEKAPTGRLRPRTQKQ